MPNLLRERAQGLDDLGRFFLCPAVSTDSSASVVSVAAGGRLNGEGSRGLSRRIVEVTASSFSCHSAGTRTSPSAASRCEARHSSQSLSGSLSCMCRESCLMPCAVSVRSSARYSGWGTPKSTATRRASSMNFAVTFRYRLGSKWAAIARCGRTGGLTCAFDPSRLSEVSMVTVLEACALVRLLSEACRGMHGSATALFVARFLS